MKDIPVYAKTASYAIEHDELEAYCTSYKMNMACKAAITDAVAKYYSDNVLHSADALKELTKKSRAVVRTGETTSYANVILVSGVTF